MTKQKPTSGYLKTVLGVAVICATLVSCTDRSVQWRTDNIDGLVPDLAFDMTDDSGRCPLQVIRGCLCSAGMFRFGVVLITRRDRYG